MKYKNILKPFILCFIIIIFSCFFCACETEQKPQFIASLNTTKVGSKSLSLSVSEVPSKITFTSQTPVLLEAFGDQEYDIVNICLSGIVNTEDAKLNSTPIKEDGSVFTDNDNPEDLFCYTDYFQFSFKVPSDTQTIRFSRANAQEPINKNRLIDNYYYLNFKWLYISADQTNIKTYEYEPENYIYIETKNIENKTSVMFIVHLTFDITFI